MLQKVLLAFFLSAICIAGAKAQDPAKVPDGPSTVAPTAEKADSVMVTIVLKHQQDKNLAEIRRVLEAQGFWDMFPPEEARVVSWTLAIGLGHIITLQVPAGAIRRMNLAIENGAWGAYNSDIYLSYDYMPVWKDYVEKREDAKADRN